MLRRRTTSPSSRAPEPDVPTAPVGPAAGDGDDLRSTLQRDGWALPRAVQGTTTPSWTLVGTVGSETATPVDTGGLVVGEGWSLDWWIGGDDRWHLPSQEAAVRQQLLDDAPVVETLVRIPGGDALHRAYGVRSPREVGDEWVVAEVANTTPVPFAVALVIRPFVADGLGAVSSITVEPVGGGSGRDEAHLVRVDGRPAVVLPRRPARVAVGNAAEGDVVATVTEGRAGSDLLRADCPDGLATMALILPLTHTSVLRAALPVGETGTNVDYPAVLPDAASVASGWEVHRRGPRLEVPERRITVGVERARAQVQLAHDGTNVRRDGHRARSIEPGATEVILGAFDVLDRPAEVGSVVARWVDMLADASPEVDALFLTVVARHWLLHRADALLDWMLPEVAAAVERIDRANRRGRLDGPAATRRAATALTSTARMLAAAGQGDAAGAVRSLADRVAAGLPAPDPTATVDRLQRAADLAAAGDPAGFALLRDELERASATTTWPGPGPSGRPIGHDLAAAAAVIDAGFATVVGVRDGGLALVPHLPDDWYGAPIEVHDLPTPLGRLSFAIRWHGNRPALLWDVSPHDGVGPVTLTTPGLDRNWQTTEIRGDALLAEIAVPEGLERMQAVAEHPDIDPAMRRPGAEPAPPSAPMPDGGSFS
jgi:hypothetical protein